VESPEYPSLDWQLLFELKAALLQGRPLPLTTLRIMRERGWIALPPYEQWVPVRAVLSGDASQETIERYSYVLATPVLLPVGQRELALFSRVYDDDAINDLYAEELLGEEVDEPDGEDDDEH